MCSPNYSRPLILSGTGSFPPAMPLPGNGEGHNDGVQWKNRIWENVLTEGTQIGALCVSR